MVLDDRFLRRTRPWALCVAALVFLLVAGRLTTLPAQTPDFRSTIGARGNVGCLDHPTRVDRLQIQKSGTYENYVVDSRWATGNRVKITADNVTVKNCEILNAAGNGIGIFSDHVVIDSCRIHHLLRGTYRDQQDAHGITGNGNDLVIKNCEIYYVSGDAIQFSPDRVPWDNVLVENCTLWTGPLPQDAAGFRRGERPGENAFDSKQVPKNGRSRITMRNCLFYGWNQPGQIDNMAAINAKENVEVLVENCVFRDNEICFRLRGPTSRGGALVTIRNCTLYNSQVGVRMEDNLHNLQIEGMAYAPDVRLMIKRVGRGTWPGFSNRAPRTAPAYEDLIRRDRQ